ncbi:MAG: SpoIID/LytB domain-containing protein [Candidatus Firestonebacteria bacterium]|nr:SpoIID/LytB domain-containing protein [Candidatus Firestonebacteria bacterium]
MRGQRSVSVPRDNRLRFLGALGGLLLMLAAGCTPVEPLQNYWSLEPLYTGPTVRIRIFQQFEVTRARFDLSDGALVLCDEAGTPLPRPAQSRHVYVSLQDQQVAVAFEPGPEAARAAPRYSKIWVKSGDGRLVFIKLSVPELNIRRNYEGGGIEVSVKYGRLAFVNQLPLELYLARVLPSEMDPEHFTTEALKAQVVVARTWALKNLSRHGRFGYNFCDATHCQVYKGRFLVSRRAERAVKETLGEVLAYQGHLAEAFYHSTCGGNTAYVHEVWGGQAVPYLSRVEDRWSPDNRPYCSHSPFSTWTILTSLYRLQRLMKNNHWLCADEELQDVKVDWVNFSGRVQRILLVSNLRTKVVSEENFRRLLNQDFGKSKILSKFYTIAVEGQQFKLSGRGLGHGVGLCQWGARGMAQYGFGYPEILKHYFQGTSLAGRYGRPASTENSPTTTP